MRHLGKLVFFISVLALVSILIHYFWIEQAKWTEVTYQKDRIEEKQISFDRKQNFDDCFRLVSFYYGIENYEKVIFFGEKCINLVNEGSKGKHLICFWLASSYYKRNNETMAMNYLEKAISLDTEHFIRDNHWIENEEMENVYNSIYLKN